MFALTGLHELTLTPKHLGERASAAGEHLLHGWAPPVKWRGPSAQEEKSGVRVCLGVRKVSDHTGPILSSPVSQLTANLPLKTLHNLSHAFSWDVICFLQLPPC